VGRATSNLPRCYLEIDTSSFEHNLNRVREMVPDAAVMAVIKADAYGHGMELAAKCLIAADEFAVTCLEDLQRLHRFGIDKPVTLLSARFDKSDLEYFAKHLTRPVIHEYEHLQCLRSLPSGTNLQIWLKVDTGMGRLGFSVEELPNVYARIQEMPGVESLSLMTHLANADQPGLVANQAQFTLFNAVLKTAKQNGQEYRQVSVLNSAGVVAFDKQAFDVVRPGLMLYGISPQAGLSADKLGLRPVMEFKSSVISVRSLPSGSSIGYGGTYTLDMDSRIAYVACGYGDGYPRHAPSGTNVFINGFLVPLVGRVSMDMLAVDIGELPVQVGDTVTLWGKDNPIEDIAEAAGTIAYELTCGITQRVVRYKK